MATATKALQNAKKKKQKKMSMYMYMKAKNQQTVADIKPNTEHTELANEEAVN
uniref:RH60824p n=1 Tax=Drosophila melanogaster TaxID=7227 RepID=C0PV21_DROME|nr:RH60824p [Drosophila melanogaster]